MELRNSGGPGYNGEPPTHLNNDVNKRPAMHWHGTYSGEFLGELATLFRTVTLIRRGIEATRGKERKMEG